MNPRFLVTIAVACVAAAATTLVLPGRPAASWHATFSPSLVEPSGAEDVGVRYARVDTGADDPWRPGQERVVMVDIRYPATDGEHPLRYYGRSQHMSELAMLAWAPGHEERLGLQEGQVNWLFISHAHRWAPPRQRPVPVVVLGAPPGRMRSSHTALAEDLASHGFVVVTVDHPYDAPYVDLWPTREVIEPQDATRRLTLDAARAARDADLAAVARRVRDLDEELAPAMAPGCTFVVSGALASQAARLTDDAMVEAQIATRFPRVTRTSGRSPSEAAAEATFRSGSTDFRRALIQHWQRDGTCVSIDPTAEGK